MLRLANFESATEKASWLDGEASVDTRLAVVRAKAAELAAEWQATGSTSSADLARRLQHFVRDEIAYVRDGSLNGRRREEFADAAVVLLRGYDDCDGKARLFVVLCRILGIDARIRPIFERPDDFVHVQADVRWPGSERHPLAESGGWLVVELILAGAEIGDNVDKLPRDAKGQRPLAGPPPPHRDDLK